MARVDLPDPSIIFTDQRDAVTGSSDGAIFGIISRGGVDTLDGADALSGAGTESSSYGIYTQGSLDTSGGNDTITGTGNDSNSFGVFLDSGALLDTGGGNDRIDGTANLGAGIFLNSGGTAIDTGAGNDAVMGKSVTGTGIDVNDGTLGTGDGNDTIGGTGRDAIRVATSGTINTGNGNDKIIGNGIAGIQNSGAIEGAAGNDTVDARIGGFSGSGTTNLGAGNDELIGFGRGSFVGGDGRDTLELPSGTYTVASSGTIVRFQENVLFGRIMVTTQFETLVAGDEAYDFDSLNVGDAIFIA